MAPRKSLRCWVLLLIVCMGCISGQWQNLTVSIAQNAFGNCPQQLISSTSTVAAASNTLQVMDMKPNQVELQAFKNIPPTLTSSNPMLGLGLVAGKSIADRWANQTSNSWQLAKDHPRNDKRNCVRVARLTGETSVEIYSKYRHNVEFYTIRAAHALIHETGIVGLPCGYFQPIEGCETIFKFIGRKWWNKCHKSFKDKGATWPSQWKNLPTVNGTGTGTDVVAAAVGGAVDAETQALLASFNMSGCMDAVRTPLTRHSRVLVISAAWDHNFHHFLVDSLSRLARSIPFLRANPDVKIHIRRFDQYAKEGRAGKGVRLRGHLLRLLGLGEDRFVSGVVLADEVLLPRAVKCNYPLASALELRLLVDFMRREALRVVQGAKDLPEDMMKMLRGGGRRRRIVLQHRPCRSEKECSTWRFWADPQALAFQKALQTGFPGVEVVLINSEDERWADCVACQVLLYSSAQMLVGLHGAGLTNIMFMPVGSLVVEIMGQFDGRMLPLCGYHGSLGAVFGVHHLLHYYDWKGKQPLDPLQVTKEAANFMRFLLK